MAVSQLRRAAEKAVRVLRDAGHTALFAGGCVRDMLMNRPPTDIDVATDAPPDRVVGLFRRTKKVGAKFGVVMVRIDGVELEVATFRAEADYADHRHPDRITFTTAEEDARRRDFTINGMFYDPVNDEVIDYVGGQQDLAAKRLRAIGAAADRFEEDHLRMLRAIRFASRLGFEIEASTFDAIRRHAVGIATISAERICQELEKILTDRNRGRGWRLLNEAGLLPYLVAGDSWPDAEVDIAARRLDALPSDASFPLAMAALLATEPPAAIRRICTGLRCSVADTTAVTWLTEQLRTVRRPDTLELADIKLLMAHPQFDDLTNLLRADLAAAGESPAAHACLVRRASAIDPADVAPPPLVTGDDLLAMGVQPGPTFGQVLSTVYRAQLNETVANRAVALQMARTLLGGGGKRP